MAFLRWRARVNCEQRIIDEATAQLVRCVEEIRRLQKALADIRILVEKKEWQCGFDARTAEGLGNEIKEILNKARLED